MILTSHDDNGHLGMERTLGLLQERFFWPKMAEDVCIHKHTCERCLTTKYALAYITPKQTAIVVAHTLWENFLVHYGWPEKILTDQGKSFKNNLF